MSVLEFELVICSPRCAECVERQVDSDERLLGEGQGRFGGEELKPACFMSVIRFVQEV